MNTQNNTTLSTRTKWSAGVLAALLLLGVGALVARTPVEAADIVVYKSPTCGCCSAWIDHLKENGFTVESHDRNDMTTIKNDMGVPGRLRSCHTAKAGDYVIEGHVPAKEIARLLKEQPKVRGLAVGGMPMGSPGMEGPRKDRYEVTAFEDDGDTSVYARY